ncbi:MAG: hypothetical protein D6767_05215 [Candidatus Hydrogenedentota bacterium]|nr:MAG: hypothetical protein D6767_05215 [Candidatus Hydrogenedentota bacterium]
MNLLTESLTNIARKQNKKFIEHFANECKLYYDVFPSSFLQELISCLDSHPWKHDIARKTQSYGMPLLEASSYYHPSSRHIPEVFQKLFSFLLVEGIIPRLPKGFTVNEYLPGQGIGFHKDKECLDLNCIVDISLLGSLFFHFRKGGTEWDVFLPENSILCFYGSLKNDWDHGIRPRKKDIVCGMPLDRSRRIACILRI